MSASERLLAAAEGGDVEATRAALDGGADVESAAAVGGRMDTALMLAAKCGHEAVARLLLDRGAEADALARTRSWDGQENRGIEMLFAAEPGLEESPLATLRRYNAEAKKRADEDCCRTALVYAAAGGHEAVARLLVERGAAVDKADSRGRTPLEHAMVENHEPVASLLLEHGADAEAAARDSEVLLAVARNGNESLARLLIEHGADVNCELLFHEAARRGHLAVVRLLVEHGAGVGDALYSAAASGHVSVARFLIEHGAAVNDPGVLGETPLVAAMRDNNEPLARLLLEHGADVAVAARDTSVLIDVAHKGNEALARLLIEHGADVNAAGKYGETPLLEAVVRGHVAVMGLLVEHGAEVDGRALGAAAQGGQISVARWLVERGAEVANVAPDGDAPLLHAAANGNEAMVLFLYEAGAQLDTVYSRLGMTAVMFASNRGHEGALRLLAELGADLEVTDDQGKTALDCAGTNGSISTARILLSYGAVDRDDKWKATLGVVPLVRDCRAAVEEAVGAAGDRDVAQLCGDYLSMVDRWCVPGR